MCLELMLAVNNVLKSYDPKDNFVTDESISELKEEYYNYIAQIESGFKEK